MSARGEVRQTNRLEPVRDNRAVPEKHCKKHLKGDPEKWDEPELNIHIIAKGLNTCIHLLKRKTLKGYKVKTIMFYVEWRVD